MEATSVDVWATTLVATYLTDPEVVAAVLPPPIEPGDEPLVKVTIATVDIPGYPTFGAGSFSVRARHEGTDGYYALFMPMTTEQSVIGGRETFGEPKKLGAVVLGRDGDRVDGQMARMGATIVEIDRPGRPSELGRPGEETRTDFYFKFLPAPDGKGFDTDPALVYCHRTEQDPDARAGDGTLTLRRLALRPGGRPAGARAASTSCWPSAAASSAARSTARCPASGSGPTSTSATTTCPRSGRTERVEQLSGRVAVVTGGAGGIGRAMGERFAREGMAVVLADVEEGRSTPPSTSCGPTPSRSAGVVTDVADYDLGGAPCATGRSKPTGPSTCCATTPASGPGPRAPCGSTSSTTGAGPSGSTSTGSSTASTPSCPPWWRAATRGTS